MRALIKCMLLLGSATAWTAPQQRSSLQRRSSPQRRAVVASLRDGPKQLGRRSTLTAIGVAVLAPISPLAPLPAALADDVVLETVVTLKELTGGLAAAPLRDIVITGANSGVGLEGAKLLVAAGHRVVCACRTQAKADVAASAANAAASGALRPGIAVGMVCDLANLSSVRTFAAAFKASKRPLDSLCLNAGLALNTADKEASRTADGFELTVGTNHLGHFLLAQLLADELATAAKREGGQPRLVVTASPVHDPTSGGGAVGSKATLGDLSGLAAGPRFEMVDGGSFDADKAYKDSKLCNVLFTAEAARRLGPRGVAVNSFSPGLIPSPDGFFRYQNPTFAKAFEFISTSVAKVSETPAFGGACLAYMAADAAPTLDAELMAGKFYDTYPPGKHQLAVHAASAEARDVAEQRRLWELSERLVAKA